MAMHSQSAPASKELDADIAFDAYPYLRTYKDGRVERLAVSTFVPASEKPGPTGVATRDVVVDPGSGVSVRLFHDVRAAVMGSKLLLIVYFHGGSFCTGSAFSKLFHRYATSLAARAGALVVSVYRLASEHPIPAAYDPWLASYADPMRMFLAGESAGANIAHNTAARAMAPDDGAGIDISGGVILLQPFFWGLDRLPSEADPSAGPMFAPERMDTLWPFLTAGAAGNDDPRLNPPAELVARLPCRRALVSVATGDVMRDRGRRYASWLRDGERRRREVTLVESEGEDHGFHLIRPARASAVALMDRVVAFINDAGASLPLADAKTEHLHAWDGTDRTCRAVWGRGSGRKNALLVRPEKPPAPGFGLIMGRCSTSKLVQKGLFARAGLGRTVAGFPFCVGTTRA